MTILDILPYEIILSPVVGADSVRIRIKRLKGTSDFELKRTGFLSPHPFLAHLWSLLQPL